MIFVNVFNFVNLKYINIEYQYCQYCMKLCLHLFSNLSIFQIVTFSKMPYFHCHVYFCLLSSQLIQLQRKLIIFLKHGKKFLEACIHCFCSNQKNPKNSKEKEKPARSKIPSLTTNFSSRFLDVIKSFG